MNGFRFGLLRRIEQSLRIAVVAGDALMTAHCALALMGFHPWVGDWLAGYSVTGFLLLLTCSYLLNFCWKYRLCLVHSYIVKCCILYEREYGFGEWADALRIALLASGIIILWMNVSEYLRMYQNSKATSEDPNRPPNTL